MNIRSDLHSMPAVIDGGGDEPSPRLILGPYVQGFVTILSH